MNSQLILRGLDGTATLENPCVLIDRGDRRSRVPLQAVADVRVAADRARMVEIVLTDSVVHRVECRNTAAVAAFAAAVGRSLPDRRDGAGSDLVTVEPLPRRPRAPLFTSGRARAVVAVCAVAWTAHIVTAFVRGGPTTLLFTVLGLLPALSALLILRVLAAALHDWIVLRRRGITVLARYDGSYSGRLSTFTFVAADGFERTYRGSGGRREVEVVYDPEDADRILARRPVAQDLLRAVLGLVLLAVPTGLAVGAAVLAYRAGASG